MLNRQFESGPAHQNESMIMIDEFKTIDDVICYLEKDEKRRYSGAYLRTSGGLKHQFKNNTWFNGKVICFFMYQSIDGLLMKSICFDKNGNVSKYSKIEKLLRKLYLKFKGYMAL